jgi:hypothetical protein
MRSAEKVKATSTTPSPPCPDPTCSDRPCGRSTPNRMTPVQMRMSRAQPKAVDCAGVATTNRYLREEGQAKPATACSMSSYESDSYYPNHADVREAPTNYRRNPWEQVKAADNLYYYYYCSLNSDYSNEYYSDDEYSRDPDVDYADTTCYQPGTSTRSSCASGAFHHDISTQPWQCQPNSSSGKSLVKQDPQNRNYPKPRKARKRHKKKRPKPSPPSQPVTGALCAQIKETQQLPATHPSPSPWRAPMNTKRGLTRDHLQH